MNKQRVGSLIGTAIGIAGLAFVARRLGRDWSEVSAAIGSASPAWIVVAFAFGLAAMATIGWNWLTLLRSPDTMAIARPGSTWFFVGQLGKYVPGGIWPIVGQAELAVRGGIVRATAYSATGISMLATLLGAILFAVGASLAAPVDADSVAMFDHRPIAAAVGAAVLGGLVVLGVDGLRRRVHALAARVTRRNIELPAAQALGMQVVRHVPVWFCFSVLNICVHRALGGSVDLRLVVELAAATCVAWIAGFVIIGVPGGLGVREAVFVSMMTGPVGPSAALSIAVVSRVVTIAADLAGAGGSIVGNATSNGKRTVSDPGPTHVSE